MDADKSRTALASHWGCHGIARKPNRLLQHRLSIPGKEIHSVSLFEENGSSEPLRASGGEHSLGRERSVELPDGVNGFTGESLERLFGVFEESTGN